jgi:hypothetical protein
MKSRDYHALKDEGLLKAVEEKDIIKQSSQGNFGMYDVMPVNNASIVSEACDRFFERKNIRYGSAWFHDRLDRKKKIQQARDERNTNS